MISKDDDRDDEPVLPEPELLAAWQVPPASPDLTDRVLAHVEAALPMSTVTALPRGPRRGGLSLAVVGVAMVAAAALVLGLAQTWSRAPEPLPPPAAVTAPPLDAEAGPAPAHAGATLVVHTTPRDATVRLDGAPLSGPSPFVASSLVPGPHRLEVERDGYLPQSRTLEGGMPLELPVELALREVVLMISVDPPKASVSLWADERSTPLGGDGARHVLIREPDVRYELEATAPGYLPRRIPLAFGGGPDEAVTLHLVPDPEAAPPARTSKTGWTGHPDLKNPFARGGDPPASGPTSFGMKDPFRAKDERAAEPATLRIGTERGATWATVFIDGKSVGATPVMNAKVTPGHHTVRWEWADGSSTTAKITVSAGETRTVKGAPPAP
jgi:hypothetical protein